MNIHLIEGFFYTYNVTFKSKNDEKNKRFFFKNFDQFSNLYPQNETRKKDEATNLHVK